MRLIKVQPVHFSISRWKDFTYAGCVYHTDPKSDLRSPLPINPQSCLMEPESIIKPRKTSCGPGTYVRLSVVSRSIAAANVQPTTFPKRDLFQWLRLKPFRWN